MTKRVLKMQSLKQKQVFDSNFGAASLWEDVQPDSDLPNAVSEEQETFIPTLQSIKKRRKRPLKKS